MNNTVDEFINELESRLERGLSGWTDAEDWDIADALVSAIRALNRWETRNGHFRGCELAGESATKQGHCVLQCHKAREAMDKMERLAIKAHE